LRHRLERSAMDRTRPEFMEFQEMQFGAVTFMLAETIFGKMGAEVTHHSVTGDFGDHAGGGNAKAEAIAVYDGGLWPWKGNHGQTIDQNVIGRDGKRGNSHAHRFMGRTQDINPVDLDRIDNADGPADFGVRY
jgi:hypothetical protein